MKLPHKHSKGDLNMSKPIIQLNEESVKSELKELEHVDTKVKI